MERDLNSLLSQEKRWESLLSKLLTVAKIFDRTNASAYIPISWVFDKESKSYAILDSRPFFELHKTFENLIGHSQKVLNLSFIDFFE